MKKELISGSIGTILSAVGTAMQPNEILEIISLVITIIGGLISFIVVPLVNWYRKSKEDGKITQEEINEGIKIIEEGTEKVKEETKKEK